MIGGRSERVSIHHDPWRLVGFIVERNNEEPRWKTRVEHERLQEKDVQPNRCFRDTERMQSLLAVSPMCWYAQT